MKFEKLTVILLSCAWLILYAVEHKPEQIIISAMFTCTFFIVHTIYEKNK